MLVAAIARDVVERYLAGLAAHDWGAVAATLAPEIERMGPYRDAYRGRETYARFLAQTIDALGGYQLEVDRVLVAGPVVTVELRETVDDGDARLETPKRSSSTPRRVSSRRSPCTSRPRSADKAPRAAPE